MEYHNLDLVQVGPENWAFDREHTWADILQKCSMNVSGIIHAGAHCGQELPAYIASGCRELLLFEPLRGPSEILVGWAGQLVGMTPGLNISIEKKALGSSNGTGSMAVSSNEGQSSSLLKAKEHLDMCPSVVFGEPEEVTITTLDDYDTSKYNTLVLDCQGYEAEIIKGATKSLDNIDYVFTELNIQELYEGCPLIEDMDALLASHDLIRVSYIQEGLGFGTGIYIKRKFLKVNV